MAARRALFAVAGAVAALVAVPGALPAGGQAAQTVSPSSLAFQALAVGDLSDIQQSTFSSMTPVTVTSVTIAGEFRLGEGSCGSDVVVVPGAAGCTVQVRFAPTSPGDKTGTATVAYGRQSVSIALSGTALAVTTTTTLLRTTTTRTTPAASSTTAPPRTTTSTALLTSTTGATTSVVPTTTVPETTTTTTTAPAPSPPTAPGATLDATAADGGRSGPPGIGITVRGSGYPAGDRALGVRLLAAPALAQARPECATVYFFLDGRRIGTARPNGVGDVRKDGLSVPGDADVGRHQVSSACGSSGTPVLATSSFDVTDAAVHRSAFATSLPQADQVDFGIRALLVSLLAVAGLMVLIAFPAELFNTTLEEHYDEVRGWFGLKPRPLGGGRHHGVLLVAFLLLSGPLWFAMQPSSAFDVSTAVGALGLSLATAVVVFASDMPEVVYVRRRYRERARPIALPGSLVIAVACVVLSRAVHFQPGYFYGLLGGLALSRSLERDEDGRLAARTVAALLALSIGSWLALLPVSAAAAENGKTFGTILVENLLGGIFWVALDSLVIAMLPLRLLEGSKIVGWSRAAWVALYGVTLLAFVHILLRPSTGYVSNTSVSPPNLVIGLFAGFAVLSFAFWGYFRFRGRSAAERPAGEAAPDEVQGAAGPEPLDVLVGEGVGAGEVEGRPVGPVEPAGDGLVGGEAVQPEDRNPV
jgi:hypothetical protein